LTLISNFRDHYDDYKNPAYNETMLRRDFLDKFIKILGWDVDNEQNHAETFREVVHEDRLRIGGSARAPDYCIQIGGNKQFYIEAKKPSVNIIDDIEPAFQVRSYGWTRGMPACLLTNFDEFVVYDTAFKPLASDKPGVGRLFYCRYEELDQLNKIYREYATNWNYLWSLFSKEAVLKGSLEKLAKSNEKRGTQKVDEDFLQEIEKWRGLLAANVALRNELTERELNDAVQKIIDRIIFLRICEDRDIEDVDTLKTVSQGKDIYAHLLHLFIKADAKYNSGLFHFKKEKAIIGKFKRTSNSERTL
jgi:hypothetical protein